MQAFQAPGDGYRGKIPVCMAQCESAGVAIVMAEVGGHDHRRQYGRPRDRLYGQRPVPDAVAQALKETYR